MSEDEPSHLGIVSDLCGLCSGAVESLFCKEGMLLGKRGFVVETGNVVYEFGELRTIGRVGTVGVGTNGVGGGGQTVVGNKGSVIGCPIHSPLDIIDLRNGNVVVIDHITSDMTGCGFLLEKVATTGDTVRKGKGGDGDGTVFIDGLRGLCVDFVENDLVG